MFGPAMFLYLRYTGKHVSVHLVWLYSLHYCFELNHIVIYACIVYKISFVNENKEINVIVKISRECPPQVDFHEFWFIVLQGD